jgi:glutamate-5-semialdehyde dehydrogenase
MLKTLEKNGEDVATLMRQLGEQARAAAHPLAIASSAAKDTALGYETRGAMVHRDDLVLSAVAKQMRREKAKG